jgi:hypothetical protein
MQFQCESNKNKIEYCRRAGARRLQLARQQHGDEQSKTRIQRVPEPQSLHLLNFSTDDVGSHSANRSAYRCLAWQARINIALRLRAHRENKFRAVGVHGRNRRKANVTRA